MRNAEAQIRDIAKRLPKIQLHLHLDGSVPPHLLQTLADLHATSLPAPPEKLREHFLTIKSQQISTDSYTQKPNGNWDSFNFINSLLRTPDDLRIATAAVIYDLTIHNVVLAEIRFCPVLYPFSPEEAVEAAVDAFKHGGLKGGIILCALRSYPPEHVTQIADLARKYKGRGVIGIDLAGDEGTYPMSLHKDALAEAVRQGVNVTAHAGEFGPSAEANLLDALSIPVKRVGHALVLRDESLRSKMGNVFVEACLTANCSGGAKLPADQFQLHPVKQMIEDGVRVAGFNCDNLLLSGTFKSKPDPTEEIVRAKIECGLTWRQIETALVDGVRASFDESVFEAKEDESFLKRFEEAVGAVLLHVIEE